MTRRPYGQQPVTVPMGGGLDIVTPALEKRPGSVIAALNYEPLSNGYGRLVGYERFDGRTAPSSGGTRASILAVPGVGPTRGVHFFSGGIYAMRNVNTLVANMYKATSGGWSQVDFGYLITINFLQKKINVGDVVTGQTSGATATVYSCYTTVRGNPASVWTTNNTTGANIQVKTGQFTGTFTYGENLTVGGVVVAKVYTTFGPYPKQYQVGANGSYQFLNFDFGTGTKIYWASGKDYAYEFDGVNPPRAIGIGMSFFTRVAVYNNALFLSGAAPTNGNHLFVSVVGDPTNITDSVLGAVEISLGSNIVDMLKVPNGLVILCENHIYLLTGNDHTDYQLELVSTETGALYYTAQRFGNPIYVDNSGIRTLNSGALGYGNSPAQTISRLIAPYFFAKRTAGVSPTTSFICRKNAQYWLFFDDGTGIVIYLEGKSPATMPVNLGVTVFSACSVEVAGVERIFLGASNGFVYELNKGNSFDGAAIEYYIRLPFYNFGSPEMLKRIYKADINLVVTTFSTISVSADFDDGSVPGLPSQQVQAASLSYGAVTPSPGIVPATTGGTGITNLASNETTFVQQVGATAEVYLDGVARNISLKIGGSAAAEDAHVITSVTYLITPRGLHR
jgi:hypothetical protein